MEREGRKHAMVMGISKQGRSARRGTALVPVLIVVVSLLGLSMALLDQTSAVKDEVGASVDDQRSGSGR